jgi:hypothetical protein
MQEELEKFLKLKENSEPYKKWKIVKNVEKNV